VNETPKLVVRIDPELNTELDETVSREERTKTTIVERALRDYIARSKAEAKAARAASKTQTVAA
jgi:predicted transcriptional regulator